MWFVILSCVSALKNSYNMSPKRWDYYMFISLMIISNNSYLTEQTLRIDIHDNRTKLRSFKCATLKALLDKLEYWWNKFISLRFEIYKTLHQYLLNLKIKYSVNVSYYEFQIFTSKYLYMKKKVRRCVCLYLIMKKQTKIFKILKRFKCYVQWSMKKIS